MKIYNPEKPENRSDFLNKIIDAFNVKNVQETGKIEKKDLIVLLENGNINSLVMAKYARKHNFPILYVINSIDNIDSFIQKNADLIICKDFSSAKSLQNSFETPVVYIDEINLCTEIQYVLYLIEKRFKKSEENHSDQIKELIRFAIVGAICTIIDYGFYTLTGFLCSSLPNGLSTILCTTVGFIFGVIANYLLSLVWVYKNVDPNINAKSKKSILLFFVFSACGLFIGMGIMAIANSISNSLHGIEDLNAWSIGIFKEGYNYLKFFLFTLWFGIKTLVVLFWNYITRKLFIFKSPIKSRIYIAKDEEK